MGEDNSRSDGSSNEKPDFGYMAVQQLQGGGCEHGRAARAPSPVTEIQIYISQLGTAAEREERGFSRPTGEKLGERGNYPCTLRALYCVFLENVARS